MIIIMIIIIIIIVIKHAYAGELNSFTHLRALLVLHDRGILAHVTNVTGHYSSSLSNIPPSANYSSSIRIIRYVIDVNTSRIDP